MACEGGGSNVRSSYYNVLGIRKDASVSDIRTAYRKLAMKWHPDRYARNPGVAGEAKRRFQQIQEAYSVLNDENKRSMYDVGLYDPHEDDDDDFCDFMQEMISMMNNVKDEGESLEDLQRMFTDMVGGDGVNFDCNNNPKASKRPRVNVSRTSAAMR
ncbi:DnaJ domain [Arabidopsis thaliana x Arabidopsis arenosa]|uniref:DnaJ domain n=1 Tax=Arabidopsis thaliana x Arabidopsis arenosa TaxID=1240361 RepID=A0A8T2BP85_9BRAS|nr:DnaJ domain [Arabidopsis thaliana x Arabidopsis arenosa]